MHGGLVKCWRCRSSRAKEEQLPPSEALLKVTAQMKKSEEKHTRPLYVQRLPSTTGHRPKQLVTWLSIEPHRMPWGGL